MHLRCGSPQTMRCTPLSRPTPAVLLNVTHIVSGQAASRSSCYFQARSHSRLQDVYLPQKLDASHHLPHPYNAGTRGLVLHLHRSTALGDRLPGHELSLSLPPVLRSLLYVEVWLNFLPKIDGWRMTLAHRLQHLEDTDARAMFLGPGVGCMPFLYRINPGRLDTPPPPACLPGLKINFISPTFQRTHRVSSTPCPSDSRRPAGVWMYTPTSTIAPGIYTPTGIPPHSECLPVRFVPQAPFSFHPFPSFLPHPPIHFTQTDLANIALPKAKCWEKHGSPPLHPVSSFVVLVHGRLLSEKNLGLLVHAFACLPA
ncbi:hypothetical protein B0H13DRAFT_2556860 [Mycena leptocephala]|nr:hypothetical protein B0H13DRAFT_2556860 [Mycena leptocephala]